MDVGEIPMDIGELVDMGELVDEGDDSGGERKVEVGTHSLFTGRVHGLFSYSLSRVA
jgi:hypothetical protein